MEININFKEFLKLSEQGTVGGIMGGPTASGRLGQSQYTPEKPVTNINPSPFNFGTKSINPPPSPFSFGVKRMIPPPSPFSFGTKSINPSPSNFNSGSNPNGPKFTPLTNPLPVSKRT
jgi:hypothetical protein